MEFLEEQEEKRQKLECMNRLRKRKQEIIERLDKLKKEKHDIQESMITDLSPEEKNCLERLDCYRVLGVSIKSLEPDLVLRFDPLYRNQYHTAEHYTMQLLRKGNNYELGKHNLPPFIPVNELKGKYLASDVSAFIEETRALLYAYVQRREGLKYVQKTFEKNVDGEIELNLPVSYIKLKFWTSEKFPEVEITLQYSLRRCVPDVVDIKPVDTEQTYSVSKKCLQQRLDHWQQILHSQDIFRAFSDIVKENNA